MKQQGVTLIELVIALVVLSIAGAALLSTYAYLAQHNADPMLTYQASAIAETYLEEVVAKSFDDPVTNTTCPAPNAGGRASYDNVCDYRGLPDTVVRDQNGNAIAGLSNYSVAVTITNNVAWQGIVAADVLRVDVTVTDPRGHVVVLAGYRTRY